MNQYVTGNMIRKLREDRKMTQAELGEVLHVSDKTVSKWETGKGYPDISLIEPLAAALGISVIELMSGNDVVNTNRAANMQRVRFHVCPVCGNVITAIGESVISCCGLVLPPAEPEQPDPDHIPEIEKIEDEYYLNFSHEMTKEHYISFVAAVRDNETDLVRLYPEGNAETRFRIGRIRYLYWYCNRHGLYRMIPGKK